MPENSQPVDSIPFNALFCIQTTGANSKSLEDNSPVAVIGTDTTESTKVCFENQQQAIALVVEYSHPFKEQHLPFYSFYSIKQTIVTVDKPLIL